MEQKRNNAPIFKDPRETSTALTFPARADVMRIIDQPTLTMADALRKDAIAMIEKIRATFDPQIDRANALHKSLIAERKKFLDPLDRAVSILKRKIADYLYEQDQKRLEAARIKNLAEDNARREAEKTIDKARELAEAGKPARADAVIEKGFAKANEIIASAPDVPPPPVVQATYRETWEFEIVDLTLIPREYMIPDRTRIGGVVRAMKDQTSIPGIRAFPKRSIADKSER